MRNRQSHIHPVPVTNIASAYTRLAREALAETFWPTRCVLCDQPGILLCNECARQLSFIDFWHRCPRCGAPWGDAQCTECNPVILKQLGLKQLPFSECVSAVVFNESSARMVRCFKDQNEQRLGEVLASYIHSTLPPSWLLPTPPPVSFIPATKKAFRMRGFDHGELLAKYLAQRIDAPLFPVFSRPSTKDQRALSRQERIVNMGNRFLLLDQVNIPQRILLVDDVYTTGSTLYAASQALKAGGCTEIFCTTFARVW